MQPGLADDKETGGEPGYSDAPRRQMDRLIESQQTQ
jgi:hypothetical protein